MELLYQRDIYGKTLVELGRANKVSVVRFASSTLPVRLATAPLCSFTTYPSISAFWLDAPGPMLNHRAGNAKPFGLIDCVASRYIATTSAPQGLCALSPESSAPGRGVLTGVALREQTGV